jgi:hypothetical protein
MIIIAIRPLANTITTPKREIAIPETAIGPSTLVAVGAAKKSIKNIEMKFFQIFVILLFLIFENKKFLTISFSSLLVLCVGFGQQNISNIIKNTSSI